MKALILENPMQRITLTMILLSAFTTPLMLSAVNVALPSIANDLSMNAVKKLFGLAAKIDTDLKN